jgi:hypothetical protein
MSTHLSKRALPSSTISPKKHDLSKRAQEGEAHDHHLPLRQKLPKKYKHHRHGQVQMFFEKMHSHTTRSHLEIPKVSDSAISQKVQRLGFVCIRGLSKCASYVSGFIYIRGLLKCASYDQTSYISEDCWNVLCMIRLRIYQRTVEMCFVCIRLCMYQRTAEMCFVRSGFVYIRGLLRCALYVSGFVCIRGLLKCKDCLIPLKIWDFYKAWAFTYTKCTNELLNYIVTL